MSQRNAQATADPWPPEPWITKQDLADHLSVTPRWIELQQPRGLPHLRTGGMNRYLITEVETWLRKHYSSPPAS